MPFPTRRTVAAFPLPYDPRSLPGLAARWVQWVAAAGPAQSPLDDPTGENTSAHQPSDVWFLAGGQGGAVRHPLAVPGGRELFFPLVTWWSRADRGPDLGALLARAHGTVAVDGTPVQPVPVVTHEPFTVTGARFNDITLRTKPREVVTGGLWASVPALAPGAHELHIVAGEDTGVASDVRHQLWVTSPGSTRWSRLTR